MNMDLGAISARAGAPNDGLKKGPDDNTRVPASASEVALWSKQNSDATGMRYQWGRKDPFTFATSSEQWGGNADQSGKYPVKLYNGSSVLIYQEDAGRGNSGKLPSGGVLASSAASSMSVVVANPITFYGNWDGVVIGQVGQSGDLYNYYFASYSRGIDGQRNIPQWHNLYLDSYIPLRHKSIYDPCPYGYRIPSNGTYNQFRANAGWMYGSYVGGLIYNISTNLTWFNGLGANSAGYLYTSTHGLYALSIASSNTHVLNVIFANRGTPQVGQYSKGLGQSVRCIEECELLPDATEASAG